MRLEKTYKQDHWPCERSMAARLVTVRTACRQAVATVVKASRIKIIFFFALFYLIIRINKITLHRLPVETGECGVITSNFKVTTGKPKVIAGK
jgi:hypothetical protein